MNTLVDKEIYELNFQKIWFNYDFDEIYMYLKEYWSKYRNYNLIIKFLRKNNPKKILDLGCGVVSVGSLLIKDFPESKIIGIDPLMDEYKRLYDLDKNISWEKGYAESIPYNDNFFDAVISSNALDHVEDLKSSLVEIHRIIKNNGMFILNVHVFGENTTFRNVGHPHNPTPDKLQKLLIDLNFKILFKSIKTNIPTGLSGYIDMKVNKRHSNLKIYYSYSLKNILKCLFKKIINSGYIGELTLICKK